MPHLSGATWNVYVGIAPLHSTSKEVVCALLAALGGGSQSQWATWVRAYLISRVPAGIRRGDPPPPGAVTSLSFGEGPRGALSYYVAEPPLLHGPQSNCVVQEGTH